MTFKLPAGEPSRSEYSFEYSNLAGSFYFTINMRFTAVKSAVLSL